MTALRTVAAGAALIAAAAFGVGCTPTPPPDDESRAACEIERRTIETALAAWQASNGGGQYPSSFEDLLGVFLDPDRDYLNWIYGADGASYTLSAPAEEPGGSRVLAGSGRRVIRFASRADVIRERPAPR